MTVNIVKAHGWLTLTMGNERKWTVDGLGSPSDCVSRSLAELKVCGRPDIYTDTINMYIHLFLISYYCKIDKVCRMCLISCANFIIFP